MIHHVVGVLREKDAGRVVVELGGFGLELLVSHHTRNRLGVVGEEVRLLTHLAVREDAWTLFGFFAEEERQLFRLLLGIQGVGPRMALGVLSGVTVANLRRCVQEGDVAALTTVSGVGKKTAQRIIVDLRDKVGALPGDAAGPVAVSVLGVEQDEAVDALVALGYSRIIARDAVRGARAEDGDDAPLELVVKDALRRL